MSPPSRVWMPTDGGWVSREPTSTDKVWRDDIQRWMAGETVIDKDTGKERHIRMDEIIEYPSDARHATAELEREEAIEAGRKSKEGVT